MRARIIVTLKNGVLDPQGKAIGGALASLGLDGVDGVRQGKVFDVDLATSDEGEARAVLGIACEKLLANTVIENYRIELEAGAAGGDASDAEMPAEGHP